MTKAVTFVKSAAKSVLRARTSLLEGAEVGGRCDWFRTLESQCPLPFDAGAARAFGGVAASLRRSGRKATARAYDAMIAATAVANDLPVYTCNPADFSGIDGLEVVPVPVPETA
jgi:hypothetical protein